MSVIEALILGLVQGLTEFLPISSSGHLVLFQKILNLSEGTVTFDVMVHLATLIAVVAVMRKDVIAMIRKPFSKLTLLVVVGTIPAGLMGVLFQDTIKDLFKTGKSLGFEFLFTGLVLWYAESVRSRNKEVAQTSYGDALVVGVAEGLAILPAVSRSGLTLAGALMRGLSREFALKFSFLMSIPIILCSALPDINDMVKGTAGSPEALGLLPMLVGMVAAAISGYLAIRFMLKVFAKTSLKVFSYYVFILGALVLADQFIFHIINWSHV